MKLTDDDLKPVGDQVKNHLKNIENFIDIQVTDQVRGEVYDQMGFQISTQIWHKLRRKVYETNQ